MVWFFDGGCQLKAAEACELVWNGAGRIRHWEQRSRIETLRTIPGGSCWEDGRMLRARDLARQLQL